MIHHTCFKCKRRFELDPVLVGLELHKLNKKRPKHYQAICPGCRVVNKVSVEQIRDELDLVTDEIAEMVAEYEQQKAEARAAKQAKARQKKADSQ